MYLNSLARGDDLKQWNFEGLADIGVLVQCPQLSGSFDLSKQTLFVYNQSITSTIIHPSATQPFHKYQPLTNHYNILDPPYPCRRRRHPRQTHQPSPQPPCDVRVCVLERIDGMVLFSFPDSYLYEFRFRVLLSVLRRLIYLVY